MEWEDIDRKAQRELLQMIKEATEDEEKEEMSEVEKLRLFFVDDLENEWKKRRKYDYKKAFGKIRRARYQRIGLRLGAAACMLGVMLGSVWMLRVYNEDVEAHLTEGRREDSRQVVLRMSDGKQVVLNGQDSVSLREDTWKIQVNKGKVDYSTQQQVSMDKKVKYNVLSVPVGGGYQVILADGTCVHLNAGSELKFPVTFSDSTREVYLKGEAFFDVVKDTEHPFVVKVGSMSVKVLGTRFNINAHRVDGVYETTLVDGKVEVSDRAVTKRVILFPNQQARLKDGHLSVYDVDVSLYTSWVDGKFYFEKESLQEIAAQLERWYGMHFFFVSEKLKQEKFTGVVLKNYTIEQILSIIEKTTNVKFSVEGQTVVVN